MRTIKGNINKILVVIIIVLTSFISLQYVEVKPSLRLYPIEDLIENPIDGELCYVNGKLYFYNGSNWKVIKQFNN